MDRLAVVTNVVNDELLTILWIDASDAKLREKMLNSRVVSIIAMHVTKPPQTVSH